MNSAKAIATINARLADADDETVDAVADFVRSATRGSARAAPSAPTSAVRP